MAAEGAKVVVNDLDTGIDDQGKDNDPAQQVVEEIKAQGGEAAANTDSVADWNGAQGIIATAIDKLCHENLGITQPECGNFNSSSRKK